MLGRDRHKQGYAQGTGALETGRGWTAVFKEVVETFAHWNHVSKTHQRTLL